MCYSILKEIPCRTISVATETEVFSCMDPWIKILYFIQIDLKIPEVAVLKDMREISYKLDIIKI